MGDEIRAAVDLVANKRGGQVRNPLDEGERLIRRFLETEPLAKMQMEELCRDYCPSCADARDAGERRELCEGRRCGLLDPVRYRQERLVILNAMHRLYHMESAEAVDVEALNQHIAQAGSATMALVQDSAGNYRRGWNIPTLRAAVHAVVITRLAVNAGDLGSMHVCDMTGREADAALRDLRRFFDERDRWRAVQLAAEKVPVAEIARRLKRSRTEVSRWINRAKRELPA